VTEPGETRPCVVQLQPERNRKCLSFFGYWGFRSRSFFSSCSYVELNECDLPRLAKPCSQDQLRDRLDQLLSS
jgi:hypothetical protein